MDNFTKGENNMKQANKERVLELIRENKGLKETNETLKKESEDSISSAAFYRLKQSLNPTKNMGEALEGGRIKRVERVEKQKTEKRKLKWSSQKQKQADESNLAKLINKGLYHGTFPLCKSKQLKEEDVQEINMGGAIVGSVLYFFPDVDLNHPIVVLATRGILFYLKFRQICSVLNQKIEEVKTKLSGIKPGWEQK
jgi:hypothetical protein